MAATVGNLAIVPDGSYAINVSPDIYVNSVSIATAGSAEAIPVPSGAKKVVFGATGSFCVRYNASAAGTAASFSDKSDGTGCEINPTARYLKGVAEISVDVAANGTTVSAMFFS